MFSDIPEVTKRILHACEKRNFHAVKFFKLSFPFGFQSSPRFSRVIAFQSACLLPAKNYNSDFKTSRDRTSMNRLSDSANLMIVSDLDLTMVDHHDQENISLLRFNALWESCYRHNSLLVYSTGRSPTIYRQLRNEKPLLTPDITITSVGTEIAYGECMVTDNDWIQFLNQKWNRDIVTEETAKFPELTPQSETEQRPHKVSFFVAKDKASGVMKVLSESLAARGLDVKIIYSSGTALDVLPRSAGKGQALAYLLEKFRADGKVPINTLVCGDSGNDADLFSVPDVYGVMVNNAQEELLQWHAENAKNNPKIIHANERCASGILEAIGFYHLGPNISPRDIKDFMKGKVEIFNPSNEVVKFYLLYEKWRRAEVEQSLQDLSSAFHPLGVFVHPSGYERPFDQWIEMTARLYGDKQGREFRVWVDRVSSLMVGPATWLVKFNKWESSGELRRCCLTTVLLSSKATEPFGFTWLHMHQTWLNSSRTEDQSTWLF